MNEVTVDASVFTFLFTDIEGSTALWEADPEAMNLAVQRHDALIREAVEAEGGTVFKTMGDAFLVAFRTANRALAAAIAIQERMTSPIEGFSLKVRSALYTGEAYQRENDFFGPALNRASRLIALGHGGQILVSNSTSATIDPSAFEDLSLRELGTIELRGVGRSEQVFQACLPGLPGDFPALATGKRSPTNLPRSLNHFIGRQDDLAGIEKAVLQSPAVTLTGSGGCGKSRLAIEFGGQTLERFPDGVWFVELASLTEAGQVVPEILSVLSIPEEAAGNQTEHLIRSISDRKMLLILDNCEHLIAECARLCHKILARATDVLILATSREPLGLAGEIAIRVPSLTMEADGDGVPEAVQLFIDRAIQLEPEFLFDSQAIEATKQVCERLDGIPLAIELAAARIKSMTPVQIAAKLDDRFRLLTGGPRTALPRQQTLRATLDWSYNLLSASERSLLTRLSVFQGGWTLDAAEAVCQDEAINDWEILDLHTQLIEKSLIVTKKNPRTQESRFRLLETVRQYVREKFLDLPEALNIRDQHCRFFCELIGSLEPAFVSQGQVQAVEKIGAELDNLRAAMEWGSSSDQGTEDLLKMAKGLHLFWEIQGRFHEGRDWMRLAISRADHSEDPSILNLQMRARNNLGAILNSIAAYEEAKNVLLAALSRAEELGFEPGIAVVSNNLGISNDRLGKRKEAIANYERGLEITGRLGGVNPRALLLDNLGILLAEEDPDRSYELIREARDLFLSVSDTRAQAVTLFHLGEVYRVRGEIRSSINAFKEAMATALTLKYELVVIGSLEGLAKAYTKDERHQEAAELYGGAKRLRELISLPNTASGMADLEVTRNLTMDALGKTEFETSAKIGASLSLEALVSRVLDQ
jgi:predicted ATPase/class 3 adenylate cyclase